MVAPLKAGLAGLGTVGSAVVRLLAQHRDALAQRCGRPIDVVAVTARDPARARDLGGAKPRWVADPVALATDPEIDVFVELMGGEGDPAKARGRGRAGGKQIGRHRQQGAARQARLRARGARRAERRRAQFRGGGGRRDPDREDAARGARRQFLRARLRHPQRHLQLHPDAHGAGEAVLCGMSQGRAAARLCRGRPDLRRRGPRHRPEARDPREHRLRHQGRSGGGLSSRASRRSRRKTSKRPTSSATGSSCLASRCAPAKGIEQRVHPTMVPKESAIAQVMGVTNAVSIDADGSRRLRWSAPAPAATRPLRRWSPISATSPAACAPRVRPARRASRRKQAPMQRHEGGYYIRLLALDRPGTFAAIAQASRRRDDLARIDRAAPPRRAAARRRRPEEPGCAGAGHSDHLCDHRGCGAARA